MKKLKKDYWNKFYKKKKAPQKVVVLLFSARSFLKTKMRLFMI